MTYRSILVHASDAGFSAMRYAMAADMAIAAGAHLSAIAYSGLTEFMYSYGAACALAPMGPQDLAFMTDNARRECDGFLDHVRHLSPTQIETRVSDDAAASALPLAARFCDLLIAGLSNTPAAIGVGNHALARSLAVHAPCPVLLVPAGPTVHALPQHVMLAWDNGMAASRAVRAALPFLRRAASVVAVCCQPQKYALEGEAPGTALAAYLACHGIEIEIITPASGGDAGSALLALAEQRSADLLVMGSFGHSRFREIVLGGVTETVLGAAVIPVLMAH